MASEHTGGWRTMESAPRESQTILVYFDNGSVELAEADEFDWQPYDGVNQNRFGISKPTHWMPLPDPPAALALTAGEAE